MPGKQSYRVSILYNTKIGATATLDMRFQGSSLNVLKLLCSNLLIGYPLHEHNCYKSSCVHNSLLSSSVLKTIVCACSNANQPCFYILKFEPFQSFPSLLSSSLFWENFSSFHVDQIFLSLINECLIMLRRGTIFLCW